MLKGFWRWELNKTGLLMAVWKYSTFKRFSSQRCPSNRNNMLTQIYRLSRNARRFIVNNRMKHEQVSIIFGRHKLEENWHRKITNFISFTFNTPVNYYRDTVLLLLLLLFERVGMGTFLRHSVYCNALCSCFVLGFVDLYMLQTPKLKGHVLLYHFMLSLHLQ